MDATSSCFTEAVKYSAKRATGATSLLPTQKFGQILTKSEHLKAIPEREKKKEDKGRETTERYVYQCTFSSLILCMHSS